VGNSAAKAAERDGMANATLRYRHGSPATARAVLTALNIFSLPPWSW